nr:MAG: VP2 [Canine parvovirus]WDW25813.1 MAG: VP2 [Canine parvovirus]
MQDGMESDQPSSSGGGERSRVPRSIGDGGSGFNGAGGGRSTGVGLSTGNYINQTNFNFLGDGWVEITAHASRLIHLNMPENEDYRLVQVKNASELTSKGTMQADDTHTQMVTPWSLIDCNAWGVWFTPGDWQWIVNSCEEMTLHSLQQEIFNVVLKTVTEQQGSSGSNVKVYNNDLTASLMVALDSNNILPYTPAAVRGETLGFFPWRPTTPTQWRYYINSTRQLTATTDSSTATVTNNMTNDYYMQFYTVENTIPIDLLRTGDEFNTGEYMFNVRPVFISYPWQSSRAVGLPPKIQTMPTSTSDYGRLGTAGQRTGQTQTLDNNIRETTVNRPFQTGFDHPWNKYDFGQQGAFKVPRVPQRDIRTSDDGQDLENGAIRYDYDYEHGAGTQMQRYTYNAKSELGRDVEGAWIDNTTNNQPLQATSSNTKIKENLNGFMMNIMNTYGPFSTFQNVAAVYPHGQIWDKEVNIEHKPRLHLTAPFVCEDNAPGQLLVKIAPNLTDVYDPNTASYSRIITYSDMWWHGTLKIKAKLRVNQIWNPTNQWRPSGTDFYLPNNQGALSLPTIPVDQIPRKIY